MNEDNEFTVPLGNPSITRYIQPPPVISASDVRQRVAELVAEGSTRELAFIEAWMEGIERITGDEGDG